MLPHQQRRLLAEDRPAEVAHGVQPLPQRRLRRNLPQAQRLAEELIVAENLDVVEVRLAQTEQADGGGHHVAMLDLRPQVSFHVDRVNALPQFCILQQGADQSQTRLGNQYFVGGGNDELHEAPFAHPPGESLCRIIISISPARTSPIPRTTSQNRHGFRDSLASAQ